MQAQVVCSGISYDEIQMPDSPEPGICGARVVCQLYAESLVSDFSFISPNSSAAISKDFSRAV